MCLASINHRRRHHLIRVSSSTSTSINIGTSLHTHPLCRHISSINNNSNNSISTNGTIIAPTKALRRTTT